MGRAQHHRHSIAGDISGQNARDQEQGAGKFCRRVPDGIAVICLVGRHDWDADRGGDGSLPNDTAIALARFGSAYLTTNIACPKRRCVHGSRKLAISSPPSRGFLKYPFEKAEDSHSLAERTIEQHDAELSPLARGVTRTGYFSRSLAATSPDNFCASARRWLAEGGGVNLTTEWRRTATAPDGYRHRHPRR